MKQEVATAVYDCPAPLGNFVLIAEGKYLTGADFSDNAPLINQRPSPVLRIAMAWLDRYFSGRDPGPTPLLRLKGTPFQEKVWAMLEAIPYGQTTTYGALAILTGTARMSAQAVGQAIHHNPISLFVPCHRVVGSDGSLVGYGGGLFRKEFLLKLERSGR